MTNIKDLLLEGIESEKNITIKEYDDLREQVNQKTEAPELYRMINSCCMILSLTELNIN